MPKAKKETTVKKPGKKKNKPKNGRPFAVYDKSFSPMVAEFWARHGLTDEKIAEKMGVGRTTLARWKNRYPEFAEALKRGKAPVDFQVENALLRRALGYEYEERSTERRQLSNGGLLVVEKVVKKHVVPDVVAAIFWLKNRQPDYWRDRYNVDANIDATAQILEKFSGLKTDDLRKLINATSKQNKNK
jgi:transcriptional regulator with XRE-family HTH domain